MLQMASALVSRVKAHLHLRGCGPCLSHAGTDPRRNQV